LFHGAVGHFQRRLYTRSRRARLERQGGAGAHRRAIENIRFFDYPAAFVGVPADGKERTTITPSSTYRFEVRNAGKVHAISWTDSDTPTTVEADRLRDLFSMIRGFIHDHPAFKSLQPAGACL
jgi:hypothetical protein